MIRSLSEFYHKLPISYYGKFIKIILREYSIVLDIGCGFGAPMFMIKKYTKGLFSIGVDVKYERVKYCCLIKHIHNCCVVADARNLLFREKSFDVILCLDLIEHLSKSEGLKLL